MPVPEEDIPDVLPSWANPLLALLWIALLGGRWVVLSFLAAVGLLVPAQVVRLDESVLLPLYLILLVITVVVTALRVVRGTRPVSASRRAAVGRDEHRD
jgi:hypothetical protein